MKTLKELWNKAIDLEYRLYSLKDLVQNEGSTGADLEVFNDEVNTFISSFHCWQQECNKTISYNLQPTPQSILQGHIKSGLLKYGVKELTGSELYTVEGATEEFVILHSIKRGLFFDCNNEISFTPAVQEVPFSYFYAEYEILTRDRLLELTNTRSPFEETDNG
jgi:hypothetical protein